MATSLKSLSPRAAPPLGRSPPSRIQQTGKGGLAARGGLLPEAPLLAQPGPSLWNDVAGHMEQKRAPRKGWGRPITVRLGGQH